MKRYLIIRNGKRTRLLENPVKLDRNEVSFEIEITDQPAFGFPTVSVSQFQNGADR